jgi:hypothetical protein
VLEVLRRPVDDPAGWLLNGVWFDTEGEFRAALDKRDARRARVMALIEAERGTLSGAPGDKDLSNRQHVAGGEFDGSGGSGFVPPRPTSDLSGDR